MEFRLEEVSKMETVTCVTAIVCLIHAFMLNPTQLLPLAAEVGKGKLCAGGRVCNWKLVLGIVYPVFFFLPG